MPNDAAPAIRHSFLDDVQGLGLGLFLCSIGMHLLTHLGLITGQTAGIAVILSYVTGISFGPVFFVVNLPFYWLAWKRLGRAFTIKSLISVTLLAVLTTLLPYGWQPGHIDRALAPYRSAALSGWACWRCSVTTVPWAGSA